MRQGSYINNQDILHWYKTPEEMKFTKQGYPILKPCSIYIPRRGLNIIPFNYALNYKGDKSEVYIHFYIQDYLFNRIWNDPLRYIEVLKQYKGIIMPDFSIYYDMPLPLQQFNHYRNLWFARMCQIAGIVVIPNIRFGLSESYQFCFDGIPLTGIVALSGIGVQKNKFDRQMLLDGLTYLLKSSDYSCVLFRTTKNEYNNIINELNLTEYNKCKFRYLHL